MWMKKSMMTHGGMLWGAALYNNGAYPMKDSNFGESYGKDGKIQGLLTEAAPTLDEIKKKGILPYLMPLPRWEIMQPGNVLRVFERGGEEKVCPRTSAVRALWSWAGSRKSSSATAASARGCAPTRSFWVYRRRDCSTRCSHSPARTTTRAIFGCPAARPRRLRQRPRPETFGAVRAIRQRGADRHGRPDHSEGRAGHPIKHKMVLGPFEPVHDLSHASGRQHAHQLLRHDLVGQRDRREFDVSRKTARPD